MTNFKNQNLSKIGSKKKMPNEKFWKYLNLNERKYENTLKLKFGKNI